MFDNGFKVNFGVYYLHCYFYRLVESGRTNWSTSIIHIDHTKYLIQQVSYCFCLVNLQPTENLMYDCSMIDNPLMPSTGGNGTLISISEPNQFIYEQLPE